MTGDTQLGWRIGELAKKTGVTTKTIRYYEQAGLLSPPARTESGYRHYSEADAERLAFIRVAKEFGFSLGEIREILAVRDRDEAPCPYVLELVTEKLADLQARIQRLQSLSGELEAIVREVTALPPEVLARKGRYCHVIENQRLRADGDDPEVVLDLPV